MPSAKKLIQGLTMLTTSYALYDQTRQSLFHSNFTRIAEENRKLKALDAQDLTAFAHEAERKSHEYRLIQKQVTEKISKLFQTILDNNALNDIEFVVNVRKSLWNQSPTDYPCDFSMSYDGRKIALHCACDALSDLPPDAELKSILQHELGHFVHQHTKAKMHASYATSLGILLYFHCARGMTLTQIMRGVVLGNTEIATELYLIKNLKLSELAASAFLHTWIRRAYSQQCELEADAYAGQTVEDSTALIEYFKKLKEIYEIPGYQQILSTHPSFDVRLQQLDALARSQTHHSEATDKQHPTPKSRA